MTAPAAIGLRARKGGAVVVAVAAETAGPRILLATSIETHEADDRLSLEPYKVAAEMTRDRPGATSAEAAAAVAEGRDRQIRLAADGLRRVIGQLAEGGHRPIAAALLVNRAGWITDLLSYSLAWPEHVPVAETLAVRDALRSGLRRCGLEIAERDEKSLPDVAAERLGLSSAEIENRLKEFGASAGKPWRKEQKLACLAAWLAVAERQSPMIPIAGAAARG